MLKFIASLFGKKKKPARATMEGVNRGKAPTYRDRSRLGSSTHTAPDDYITNPLHPMHPLNPMWHGDLNINVNSREKEAEPDLSAPLESPSPSSDSHSSYSGGYSSDSSSSYDSGSSSSDSGSSDCGCSGGGD